MTSHGFYLCGMNIRTYTRAAPPGPFCYDGLFETSDGSPIWADVIYFRDLAAQDYEGTFGFEVTAERIIKTACLMVARGLDDAAAELILKRGSELLFSADQMLDPLAPNYLGSNLSYRQYMEKFEADPEALFPSRRVAAD